MLTWASVLFACVDTFPVDIMLTHLAKKSICALCDVTGGRFPDLRVLAGKRKSGACRRSEGWTLFASPSPASSSRCLCARDQLHEDTLLFPLFGVEQLERATLSADPDSLSRTPRDETCAVRSQALLANITAGAH